LRMEPDSLLGIRKRNPLAGLTSRNLHDSRRAFYFAPQVLLQQLVFRRGVFRFRFHFKISAIDQWIKPGAKSDV
jgi:hypothetical protein